VNAVTLDAGALIALDRDHRRMIALLAHAADVGVRVTVPATALAQAMRAPARQARLSRLVRQPTTDVVSLDVADAISVGVLLSATRTSDIADAHVALCARRNRGSIVTSDPDDLARLDPDAHLVRI
jgi:predicted nucleic acid-binding protein